MLKEEYFPHKDLSYQLRGIFFKVQNDLGTKMHEKHYQRAVATLLTKNCIRYETEKAIKIFYEGVDLGMVRLDLVVDDKLILELKTTDRITSEHQKQLIRYLESTRLEVGYIVNFRMRPLQIMRVINPKTRSVSSAARSASAESITHVLKDRLGEELKRDIPLAQFTTFRIGGPARYFFVAHSADEMTRALSAAVELGLPYFILAGGSNLLIADRGFNGLVIKDETRHYTITGTRVYTEAGIILDELVRATVEHGLKGMEPLVDIPGTVGGAIRGNAGAYGAEIKDVVVWVQAATVGKAVEVVKMTKADCHFAYRHSIFKENPKLIVLAAELEFEKGDREAMRSKMEEVVALRRSKYPKEPSSGCMFKNSKFALKDGKFVLKNNSGEIAAELIKKMPKQYIEWGTLPTAWVISELGLAGTRIGDAEVSPAHKNFVVNMGQATAKDVLELISLVRQKVHKVYGLELEEEVQLVGF